MQRRCVSPRELEYYRGNLREAIREDGLVCLECGTLHSGLGRHVAVHRLTLRAYRAKWGYARKARLAIPYPLKGVLRPAAAPPRALEYYRTHLMEAVQGDHVVCLECGGAYRLLGSHVRAHRQTTAEYREKWGYTTASFLMTPAVYKKKLGSSPWPGTLGP